MYTVRNIRPSFKWGFWKALVYSAIDTYIFKGKRTTMSWEKNLSQYQQIGNAVPPLMAKAIAKSLKKIL